MEIENEIFKTPQKYCFPEGGPILQSSTYTLIINHHITNIHELIVYIFLSLGVIAILLYQSTLLIQLFQHALTNVKAMTYNLKINLLLYLEGLLQLLCYSYQIFGYCFDYQDNDQKLYQNVFTDKYFQQYVSMFVVYLPIILLIYIIFEISQDYLEIIDFNSNYRIKKTLKIANISFLIICYLLLIIRLCMKGCVQSIIYTQPFIFVYYLIAIVSYLYSSKQLYYYLKDCDGFYDNQQRIQLLLSWIFILLGAIQRSLFIFARIIDFVEEQWLIKFKYSNQMMVEDNLIWSYLQFEYYTVCNLLPYLFLVKLYRNQRREK